MKYVMGIIHLIFIGAVLLIGGFVAYISYSQFIGVNPFR